jgi:hypothetical protein
VKALLSTLQDRKRAAFLDKRTIRKGRRRRDHPKRPRAAEKSGSSVAVVDTAMEPETNATTGLKRENSLLLSRGPLSDGVLARAMTSKVA